jgi:hypothetical protein
MSKSFKQSPSLRFPNLNPVCTTPVSHMCHMHCVSHSFLIDQPNNIWWGVQVIKLLSMQSSPPPCYFATLRPKYLPQRSISNTLSLCSSLSVTHQVSHSYKTTGGNIVLYILISRNNLQVLFFWISRTKIWNCVFYRVNCMIYRSGM